MPVEVKKIYFSQSELKKALSIFSTRRNKYLDYSDIKVLEIIETPNIIINIEVEDYLDFEDNRITYCRAEIAAALMSFSMDCKIPLPKLATKELHMDGDQIFLVIKLGHAIKKEENYFEIG